MSESEVSQSCPTLCDPMDCNLPGSSVHGLLQPRILEWVAISFLKRSSQPRDRTRVSHIGGRCFTIWATREALRDENHYQKLLYLIVPFNFHSFIQNVFMNNLVISYLLNFYMHLCWALSLPKYTDISFFCIDILSIPILSLPVLLNWTLFSLQKTLSLHPIIIYFLRVSKLKYSIQIPTWMFRLVYVTTSWTSALVDPMDKSNSMCQKKCFSFPLLLLHPLHWQTHHLFGHWSSNLRVLFLLLLPGTPSPHLLNLLLSPRNYVHLHGQSPLPWFRP